MRVQAPDFEEQPLRTPDDLEVAPKDNGSVSDLAPGDQTHSNRSANTPRARRGPDYRLRGLDLGTEANRPRPAIKARPRSKRRRQLVFKWVLVLVVAAVGASLLRMSVVQPFSVPSSAMLPTLQPGDRILVVKSSRLAGAVRGGDIVVFRRPAYFPCSARAGSKVQDLVQRVVAVPGETIWSKGNRIYVNGRLLTERGWFDRKFGQVGPTPILLTKVPPGKYYVMGDNRSDSCDSRAFGTIAKASIVGKVFAIVLRHHHLYVHFF